MCIHKWVCVCSWVCVCVYILHSRAETSTLWDDLNECQYLNQNQTTLPGFSSLSLHSRSSMISSSAVFPKSNERAFLNASNASERRSRPCIMRRCKQGLRVESEVEENMDCWSFEWVLIHYGWTLFQRSCLSYPLSRSLSRPHCFCLVCSFSLCSVLSFPYFALAIPPPSFSLRLAQTSKAAPLHSYDRDQDGRRRTLSFASPKAMSQWPIRAHKTDRLPTKVDLKKKKQSTPCRWTLDCVGQQGLSRTWIDLDLLIYVCKQHSHFSCYQFYFSPFLSHVACLLGWPYSSF